MIDFEKYAEEIRKFQLSKRFRIDMMGVLEHINQSIRPVKSYAIEKEHGLTGAKVRKIVQTSRNAGIPLGSGEDGYYIITDKKDLIKTTNHLKRRAYSLLRTVNNMVDKFEEVNR